MNVIKAFPFTHNGLEHEVVVSREADTFVVQARRDGSPVNGYQYSVHAMLLSDALQSGSIVDPVMHLVNLAKSDVEMGIWEQYVQAVNGRA